MKVTTGNACVATKIPSQTLSHIMATEPTVKTDPLVVLVLEPDWTGQGLLCLDPGPAKLQTKPKKNKLQMSLGNRCFQVPVIPGGPWGASSVRPDLWGTLTLPSFLPPGQMLSRALTLGESRRPAASTYSVHGKSDNPTGLKLPHVSAK